MTVAYPGDASYGSAHYRVLGGFAVGWRVPYIELVKVNDEDEKTRGWWV